MSASVLAIDPGPEQSAFIHWNDAGILAADTIPNAALLERLRMRLALEGIHLFAIEMIACYGMAVGRETFETCLWIGRFIEASGRDDCRLVYRREVKIHLCGSMKAKDGNIRQALIDKHGAPGTKRAPGKTYGISGHLWAALAVADYALSNPQLP